MGGGLRFRFSGVSRRFRYAGSGLGEAASLDKGSVVGRGEARLVSSISISVLINAVDLTSPRPRYFRPSFAVASGRDEKSLVRHGRGGSKAGEGVEE